MGNVQMEASMIRYGSGTVKTALDNGGGGGGSSTLAGLTDTDITTPTNGQVLAYDSTESKWVNAASASGATTLEGLTDTAISTPSDGQVLTYDSTAEKWENAAIPAQSIDGLSDTTITTPSDGQVLTYDATAEKWENATPASGVTTLAALTDTDITTPSDGQVLTYDSTAAKWVNASGGSGGGGEVYPTTATKIGTFDGSDLYRRCFRGNISSGGTVVSSDLKNDNLIVSLTGVYTNGDGVTYALPFYKNSNSYVTIEAQKTSYQSIQSLSLSHPSGITSGTYIVVVDYTKPATP